MGILKTDFLDACSNITNSVFILTFLNNNKLWSVTLNSVTVLSVENPALMFNGNSDASYVSKLTGNCKVCISLVNANDIEIAKLSAKKNYEANLENNMEKN